MPAPHSQTVPQPPDLDRAIDRLIPARHVPLRLRAHRRAAR
jgi:hypothetical protein